MSVIHVER